MFFKSSPKMDDGIRTWQSDTGSVLLDVRTPEEFAEGHVRGAINVELAHIEAVREQISDLDQHVYVYCRSGARSGRAVSFMQQLGYTHVENIGGVLTYSGQLVR